MPAAKTTFMDHGQWPNIADLEYKTASMARFDVYSKDDGSKRKGRNHDHIGSHSAAMPKQLDVEVKPADDTSNASSVGIFTGLKNKIFHTVKLDIGGGGVFHLIF